MNAYERYCAWNKALFDFFFDNSSQEVILCVYEDVLNEIGKGNEAINNDLNGMSYIDHFIASTCIRREDRVYFPYNRNSRSLHQLIINSTERTEDDNIECLAFACMILYLFQKGNNTEKAVKKSIDDALGTPESFNFNIIEKLWDTISNRSDDFERNQLAENSKQPFAGRLKYHLVLRKSVKDRFLRVLSDNDLIWDEQMETFSEFINHRVWRLLERDLQGSIRGILAKTNNHPYFESIIRHYDYKQIQQNSDQTQRVLQKNLLYIYQIIDDGGTRKELLYYKVDDPSSPAMASKGLNGHLMFIRSDNILPTNTLEFPNNYDFSDLNTNKNGKIYSYRPTTTRGFNGLLLQRKDIGFYEQVYEPQEGKAYLYVSNPTARFLPEIIRKQNKKDVTGRINAFDRQATCYYISSWHESSNIRIRDKEMGSLKEQYPRWTGGLISPVSRKHEYLYCALPYVEFKTEEDARNAVIEWRIVNSDNPIWKNIEKSRRIANRCYLNDDISTPDCTNTFKHIELRVRKENGFTHLLDLKIAEQRTATYSNIFGYNEFGESVENYTRFTRANLNNNIMHSLNVHNDPSTTPLLFDILLQYSSNGIISQTNFKSVLNYILKYYNYINDDSNRSKLINSLTTLGFINSYYNYDDACYYNQLNKPQLHRIPKRAPRGFEQLYLLSGCYSSVILNRLKDVQGIDLFYIPVGYQEPFDCLPDLVLIDIRDRTLIQNGQILDLSIFETPIAYDIITNIADFYQCKTRYLDNSSPEQHTIFEHADYPFIEKNNDYWVLNWFERGCQKRASQYYDTNRITRDIPRDYMNLFVQKNKHNYISVLIANYINPEDQKNFKSICFTEQMGVPVILRRALAELAVGLPKKEKVFIVNGSESGITDINKQPLYTYLESYSISASEEIARTIVNKLSGRNLNERDWNSQNSAYIAENPILIRYKMLIKITKDDFDRTYTILLFDERIRQDNLCAFWKKSGSENFFAFKGNRYGATWMYPRGSYSAINMNELFSAFICSPEEFLRRTDLIPYEGEVPQYNDNNKNDFEEVTIIKKL